MVRKRGAPQMKKNKTNKIGTLTFHMAHNFGAMLQAYALQRAISRLGGDCEIIDYRFPYIDQWSGLRTYKELCKEVGFLKAPFRFLRLCYRHFRRPCSPMRKKFDAFMRSMKLSRTTYFSKEQLKSAKYDFIVTGSDQIWNPDLTNGPAEEYFGRCFDLSRTRLISYAASNGKNCLPPEHADMMLHWLRDYKALGIREKSFADNLHDNYGLQTLAVPDPVFLLSAEEWRDLANKADTRIREPYLLLYAFQVDSSIYDLARQIASERNLKLVSIQYKYDDSLSDMIQLTDCGPLDFISLFSGADFVCTSSFHGNAFAIIFEKKFLCVGHPLYSQRNRDMLAMFNLSSQFVSQPQHFNDYSISIDYQYCNNLCKQEVYKAECFLRKALELTELPMSYCQQV